MGAILHRPLEHASRLLGPVLFGRRAAEIDSPLARCRGVVRHHEGSGGTIDSGSGLGLPAAPVRASRCWATTAAS